MIDDILVGHPLVARNDAPPKPEAAPGPFGSALRLATPVVGQQFLLRHARGDVGERLLFTGLLTTVQGAMYSIAGFAAYEAVERILYYN